MADNTGTKGMITVLTRETRHSFEIVGDSTYTVDEQNHLTVKTETTTATFHSAMWVSVTLVTDEPVADALAA